MPRLRWPTERARRAEAHLAVAAAAVVVVLAARPVPLIRLIWPWRDQIGGHPLATCDGPASGADGSE